MSNQSQGPADPSAQRLASLFKAADQAAPKHVDRPRGSVILQIRGLTKRFPGVLALDRVDLDVRRAEVHGLLGENGAGKSTLIKILTGAIQPDAGEIVFDGKRLEDLPRAAPWMRASPASTRS